MLFHTFLAYVVAKTTKEPIRILHSAKSVFYKKNSSSTSDTNGITSVEAQGENPAAFVRRPKTAMTDYGRMDSNDKLSEARKWNHLGKVIYVVLYAVFNLVFWIVAITEYMRPAEEYINNDKLVIN